MSMRGCEAEGRHDPDLARLLAAENNNLPAFFNAVFGFLSRHCPEEIYGRTQISGEHLVSQSYCKWRQRYLDSKVQESLLALDCEDVEVPGAVREEVVGGSDSDLQHPDTTTVPQCDATTTTPQDKQSGRRVGGGGLDTNSGADLGHYSWTQSIEDLEVRIPVSPTIRKGKQVRVTLQNGGVEVCVPETGVRGWSWKAVMEGSFPREVRSEESLWSLVPGEHISIHLEKAEELWWDRLLITEDPIDLARIDAHRDYSSLPESERQRIRELVFNRHREEQGKPTSDQMRVEGVLKEAWDAEGSPFKGQQFDPSVLDMAASGGGILGHT